MGTVLKESPPAQPRGARYLVPVALVALLLVGGRVATGAETVEVASCGVVFSTPTYAYLSGDLDCSSWNSGTQPVVGFITKATLDLGGFTLTAPTSANSLANAAVGCARNCTVVGGGGTIVGGHWGIVGVKNVRVFNTTIRGTSDRGVAANRSVWLDNVVVTGNATHAVTAALNATIERSSITENGGTGWPSTGELHKTSAVVFASRIRLSESTVHSNAWAGMEADRIRVRDSAVFGNGTFPECGITRNCKFDIGSRKPVRFENSACDASLDLESCGCDGDSQVNAQTDPALHNWGICAND